jgi:hypothetical protein
MSVSFSDPSVYTQNKYFNTKSKTLDFNGDPTDMSLNPPQLLRNFPCRETQIMPQDALQNKIDKTNNIILRAYPNIRYSGMTQKESNKMLIQQQTDIFSVEQLNENAMFSKPMDGEKQNKAAVVAISLKNPEFILSRINDKETEEALEDPNSIRKPWYVDGGVGELAYENEASNAVKMVIDSNTNYVERRDRFVSSTDNELADKGAKAQVDILAMLKQQDMEYKSSISSIPQRNKGRR